MSNPPDWRTAPRPAQSPVIVLGMHRSGTTVLTRMLESLGLYLGWKQEMNSEAVFFVSLNDWLLRSAGASWDQPEALRHLIEHPETRALTRDYLRLSVSGPRTVSYLGWKRYRRYRGLVQLDFPWGFKDPRASITLPLWRDVFPNARVIHLRRHGVDVAQSLRKSWAPSTDRVESARALFERRKWLYSIRPMRSPLVRNLGLATLDGCFGLWEHYIRCASAQVSEMGPLATEVEFEALMARPTEELGRLATFCGLTPSADQIDEAARKARADRSLAFRHDAELIAFARKVRDRLAECIYDVPEEPLVQEPDRAPASHTPVDTVWPAPSCT